MINPSPLAGEGRLARGERGEGWPLATRAKWMRANPTSAEERLWTMVRDRRLATFKFRRQVVIAPYIVDSLCFERRLIIEADGSHHADSRYDERRDAFLRGKGFAILRFWNNDILTNAAGVFDAIADALATPHPARAMRESPSPARGRGVLIGEAVSSDATSGNGLLVILLRATNVVTTGLFVIIYGIFATFIWNESIPFIRALHAIYIALVVVSLVYGFFGCRPLVGLTANFVMLGLPLIIILGSV